jgi:CHASE2 domain-containing sensor protein
MAALLQAIQAAAVRLEVMQRPKAGAGLQTLAAVFLQTTKDLILPLGKLVAAETSPPEKFGEA